MFHGVMTGCAPSRDEHSNSWKAERAECSGVEGFASLLSLTAPLSDDAMPQAAATANFSLSVEN